MNENLQGAGGQEESGPPVSIGMLVVLCTFPDAEKARSVAKEIVLEGLAACVNLVPGVESIYRWEGEIQQDAEVLAIFKVASGGFGKLEKAIIEKHPYETPEVVGIAADQVESRYLAWVVAADSIRQAE